MTRQVKLKLDIEHTTFIGGGGGTLAARSDREDEHLISTLVQLLY